MKVEIETYTGCLSGERGRERVGIELVLLEEAVSRFSTELWTAARHALSTIHLPLTSRDILFANSLLPS